MRHGALMYANHANAPSTRNRLHTHSRGHIEITFEHKHVRIRMQMSRQCRLRTAIILDGQLIWGSAGGHGWTTVPGIRVLRY